MYDDSAFDTSDHGAARAEPRVADLDLLRVYLDDIGRIPVPSHDEQVALARRVADGDRDAQAEMVRANLRLVVHWATRYQATGVELGDLIQFGTLGLIRAVEKFDWRRGYKFSTYASWWIRQGLQRGVQSTRGTIYVPDHTAQHQRRVAEATERLSEQLDRTPTTTELVAETGLTIDQVHAAVEAASVVASLDQPVHDESDTPLQDLVAEDERSVEADVLDGFARDLVERALDCLPDDERQVIETRYGLVDRAPESVGATARRLRTSPQRIHELERRALTRLADADTLRALHAA